MESRTCQKCGLTFQRLYNLKLHIKTAHKNIVAKLECPLCQALASTITNLRVHIQRAHSKSRFDGKRLDGMRIRTRHIKKSALKNGRCYIRESSETDEYRQSDDDDIEMNISLATLANRLKSGADHMEIDLVNEADVASETELMNGGAGTPPPAIEVVWIEEVRSVSSQVI